MTGPRSRLSRNWRDAGRDLSVYLISLAGLTWLPHLLSGPVHRRTYSVYRLLWLNLTGHAYRMPIDTPQPLLVLRAGLTGQSGFFVAAVAVFALLPVILGRLGDRLFDHYWIGLVAFLLVLLGNRYVLPGPFLIGYWPIVYFTMAAAALYLFAARRYGWCFSVLGLSGLLRPESWGLTLALWGLLYLVDRDGWRSSHGLALLAAPAWIGFDWLLSGDPLYSYHTLQQYRRYMPLDPTDWTSYWPDLLADVSSDFAPLLLAVGALGLVLGLLTARGVPERRAHWAALILAGAAPLGYWIVSAITEVIVQVRFLVVSFVVLLFYAASVPVGLARSFRTWRSLPRAAEALLLTVWTGLLLASSRPARVWKETRESARERARTREARDRAIRYLHDHWRGTERTLLAGRSIEVFELALGESASRRMRQFRVVGREARDLARLGRGTAVYLYGDVAGYGLVFEPLRSGVEIPYGGLLFEPVHRLEGPDEGSLGFIYRFAPTDAPGIRMEG